MCIRDRVCAVQKGQPSGVFHDPDLFFGKHDVSGRAAAHTPVCDRGSAGAVWNQQFLGDHIGVFHRRMGSGPSLFPV